MRALAALPSFILLGNSAILTKVTSIAQYRVESGLRDRPFQVSI